jgi:hypothetical protein
VVIRHGQEVRLSCFEPALGGAALALRTVPVTARNGVRTITCLMVTIP